jgi:methyl-accepting chemotaxis protein
MQRARDAVHATASRDDDVLMKGKTDLETMSAQVNDLETMLSTQASQAAVLSDRIGRSTADAVRSLQFEDIVRQVAEHADTRVGQLGDFFRQLPTEVGRTATVGPEAVSAAITAAADELAVSAPARPAVQDTITTGEVELF